jgi:hypothetical protein
VAVLCLGNSDDVRLALVEAVLALRHRARAAAIVDLTERGGVALAAAQFVGREGGERPEVFRPNVVPSLAQGPSDLATPGLQDAALAKAMSGVTLVLADFDQSVGVDYLTAWADRVVVAVTAGRSSVSLVRTAADLIYSSGLQCHGAVLLHAVHDDPSSGLMAPAPVDAVATMSDDGTFPAFIRPSLQP